MKLIKIKTTVIENAAKEAGTTQEGFVSRMRSLSLGRKVCAHFKKTEGDFSIFLCA